MQASASLCACVLFNHLARALALVAQSDLARRGANLAWILFALVHATTRHSRLATITARAHMLRQALA